MSFKASIGGGMLIFIIYFIIVTGSGGPEVRGQDRTPCCDVWCGSGLHFRFHSARGVDRGGVGGEKGLFQWRRGRRSVGGWGVISEDCSEL